ncbi:AraC-like DNA-binding protein [Pedobacter africanus]|uniref:AraC-like DNA-binding protein n=1 Tax=Pedobacter africanus TaxID=151894 RepID=A0ACC6KW20_9SPHI|nr:helix-turn-helix domain-containing protein [Pedobacter africanus]MDR6783323.1 AraC-like DNA-binding protein [Pedobacter africanus]
MNNIDRLLEKLNKMVSLSKVYEEKLRPLPKFAIKKSGYRFIKSGKVVRGSWQLISGYVIAFTKDANGNLLAMNIYTSGQFFTEISNLLNEQPALYEFVAIGKVQALQMTQVQFKKLNKYPETGKLWLEISIKEYDREALKDKMLLLPKKERIIKFFQDYDIFDLPDKYAANFLRIPLDEYLELKVMLLDSGEIKVPLQNVKPVNRTFKRQSVYEVKQYLKNNYARQEGNSVNEIASHFNTSPKTLARAFGEVLGTSVHKLLLRIRMEKAFSLIVENKIPYNEVNLEVGYKDIYYFNKAFKKYHGFSAKEAPFRKL